MDTALNQGFKRNWKGSLTNKELPILIEKGIIAGITGKRMTFCALGYPR
jgi:hypothetical protein